MKIGKSKVGDGSRLGYTLSPVQGVVAKLESNTMKLSWNSVTTFDSGSAIPTNIGLQIYYQVEYSNDSNFNNVTQIWTGIPGSPANVVEGNYYTPDTFNAESPSLAIGAKYVLLKPVTTLLTEIPLRSNDATNVVSGVPASDVARNFYFRVRASLGQPDNPQALNQNLTKYQLCYPDGKYGNWGEFSPLTTSSTLIGVLWTNTTSLTAKLRVVLDNEYINSSDSKYSPLSIESGLEYKYTKRDVIKPVVLSSVNVGSIKIISTDVEGLIRNFKPDDPTNYTVEPLSVVEKYTAPFTFYPLKLTSTPGTKTVTFRAYQSQDLTGSYIDDVVTTVYDNAAPSVTSIPILINGTPGNLVSAPSSTVALDLRNVDDHGGSLPYLVYVNKLNGSVTSKYYLYSTTLDITNDLNLQSDTTTPIKLEVQIIDKADNVTAITYPGDLTVKLSVNDPGLKVYTLKVLSDLYPPNETDETARNIALKFTNSRDVKIYVDNSGEPVKFWRYAIVKNSSTIPVDSSFSGWIDYPVDDSMKFSITDVNRGYAINLGSDDQVYYRVWVQTKLDSQAVSKKVFYDIWLDTTLPTVHTFAFATTTTNNPDVMVNNIVCYPNDPVGSPASACYQMKVFGDGVSAVSKTINDLPTSENLNKWIPFSTSVRFKLDSSIEGVKTVKFVVKDFALNKILDADATTVTITLQLSGPTFSYVFTYNDGSVDPETDVNKRLAHKIKGYYGSETTDTVKNVKIKLTFSDPVKAATVRRISVKNESSGDPEQVYTSFDPSTLYASGFLTLNPVVLIETADNGKNNITIKVTDNANNVTTQTDFVVLDINPPQERVVSFPGAIKGGTVTSRNLSIVISCKDRTTAYVKITGDITNPDANFTANQLQPAVSFNPGDNPTLDGLLHSLSATISKNLTDGDGRKSIRIEFQDYALNNVAGSSDHPGENFIITLDTSGGNAPLHLKAQGRFPNEQYNNNHIVLTWEVPTQQTYSIAYYNIYEIKTPPYDFNAIYGHPTYTTKNETNPLVTTWLIQNVPQEEIGVPRHYRVTAVVTGTFNESPYSNEAPAPFAGPFKLTLNFQDIVPSAGSGAAISAPAAAISLPRTLNKDQMITSITPNDLVSYVGTQYSRTGWDDLITKVYVWDNVSYNGTTKTTGNWIIITKTSPLASTYLIKEGEGLVLEFISSVVGTVKEIIFDGLPWSYGTFSISMKKGLNFIGIPRVSYVDPPALATAVNKVVEVSGFNEKMRTWDSFVSAIPAYKPEILDAFQGGIGYFIRVTDDVVIDFVGDIWPSNV